MRKDICERLEDVTMQAGIFSDFCEFIHLAVGSLSFDEGSPGAHSYTELYIPAAMWIISEKASHLYDKLGKIEDDFNGIYEAVRHE